MGTPWAQEGFTFFGSGQDDGGGGAASAGAGVAASMGEPAGGSFGAAGSIPIAVDMIGRPPAPMYANAPDFGGGSGAVLPPTVTMPRFSGVGSVSGVGGGGGVYPFALGGSSFAPAALPPLPLYAHARRPLRGAVMKENRVPQPPEDDDDWVPDTRVGRQRVMTKCPQCGHSNHIRRKICQNCQAPKPPPAKRKRRRRRKSLAARARAQASASAHSALASLHASGPGVGVAFPSAVSLQPLPAPPPPPHTLHGPPLDHAAALDAVRARGLLTNPQLQPLQGPPLSFDTAHPPHPREPRRDR